MTILKIGDKAPEFNALDENEKSISLTNFYGKKVILYFLRYKFHNMCGSPGNGMINFPENPASRNS